MTNYIVKRIYPYIERQFDTLEAAESEAVMLSLDFASVMVYLRISDSPLMPFAIYYNGWPFYPKPITVTVTHHDL